MLVGPFHKQNQPVSLFKETGFFMVLREAEEGHEIESDKTVVKVSEKVNPE